jgi:hypothetical protein
MVAMLGSWLRPTHPHGAKPLRHANEPPFRDIHHRADWVEARASRRAAATTLSHSLAIRQARDALDLSLRPLLRSINVARMLASGFLNVTKSDWIALRSFAREPGCEHPGYGATAPKPSLVHERSKVRNPLTQPFLLPSGSFDQSLRQTNLASNAPRSPSSWFCPSHFQRRNRSVPR